MEIGRREVGMALGSVAAVGAVAVAARFGLGIKTAVTQGGSPWGGPINWFLARRGPIGFGIKEAVKGNLHESLVIKKAEETVRLMENQVFYGGAKQVGKKIKIGYDNGPDAFRHTGGSAMIMYRLIQDAGLEGAEKAAAIDDLLAHVRRLQDASDVHAVFKVKPDAGDSPALRELKKRVELFVAAQRSHETDNYLHLYDEIHFTTSGDMDFWNNAVGATTAIEQAARHARMGADELARLADDEVRHLPGGIQDALKALDPGERVVLAKVLDGIESGRSVSMTPVKGVQYRDALHPTAPKGIHQEPHPSSAGDIYLVDDAGVPLLDDLGRRQVRLDAPHAAGFPQPFKDGRYHPEMERVKMDLPGLFKRRPELSH